jgi:YihY family inner membrane protein
MDALGPGYVFLAMNMAKRTLRAVDEYQQKRAWLAFPVAVWKKFGDDQAGNLAMLVAWFAFVSIFPLMLVLVTVLDIVLRNNEELQRRLLNSALSQYPLLGQQLGHIGPMRQSGLALAVGLAGTFLGALGVARAMQNALNTAWEIPYSRRPGFPWSWLRSMGQITVIGLGLIGTTILSTMASGAGQVLTGAGATMAAYVVSLAASIGLFWLAFRLGTAREIGWRQLRLAAVIAGVIWQILQGAGGYFISHQLAHASPVYGTFAIVIGLITWLYLEAQLTLYAVEASVVRTYRLWPRSIAPPPYTEQDRRAYQLYAQVEKRVEDEEIVVGVGGEDDRGKTSG